MLDVDDVVADLQIAEIGEECRHLRFLPLRTQRHVRFVKQVACAKDREVRLRQQNTVGNVGLGERRGEHLAREVAGFVRVALPAAGAASQAERNVVLGEDVGQSLDLAGVGSGEENLLAIGNEFLDFIEHRRHGSMEARSRLREKRDRRIIFTAGDAQVLNVGSGKCGDLLPPRIRRQVQIFRADEIADAAAFMHVAHALPEAIELLAQLIRFVEKNRRARKQIEDGAVSSGDGSVELPAGKRRDSAGAHGRFDDFLRSRFSRADDALAREPRMNRAQQLFADRSFGERQKKCLVHRAGRALRGRIEAADRVDLVAEKLDAYWPLGLRRVDVQNAAAQRILAGHFHDIRRAVANRVQMRQQGIGIEGLAAPNRAGQVGVVFG